MTFGVGCSPPGVLWLWIFLFIYGVNLGRCSCCGWLLRLCRSFVPMLWLMLPPVLFNSDVSSFLLFLFTCADSCRTRAHTFPCSVTGDMIGCFSVIDVSLLRQVLGSWACFHFSPLAFLLAVLLSDFLFFFFQTCINKDCKKLNILSFLINLHYCVCF